MKNLRKTFDKNAIKIFLFTLLILLFSMPSYQGSGDTVPNELLPITIINERNLDFNEFLENSKYNFIEMVRYGSNIPYFFSRVNERVVSLYPIIPGILNLPVFVAAQMLGLELSNNRLSLSHITSVTIAILSVVFIYLSLINLCTRKNAAIFITLVYALGTGVWSVSSKAIWQHGPSIMFLSIALFFILNKNEGLTSYSGFFLGMAVFNRPANIFIAVTLAVYIFFHHRNHFAKFALFAGVPALLLCLYSYAYWDNIFALGQGQVRPSVGESYFDFFDTKFLAGFTGILFSPSRGLLVYSPIFIFSFIFIIPAFFAKGIEPLCRYLSLSIIFTLFFYAKWTMWWGGYSFGYRLLTEIIPLLTILLAMCWERYIVVCQIKSSIIFKAVFYLLTLYSVFVHFLGAFYTPCGFNYLPNSIDLHTERLWDFQDTQIERCFGKMQTHFIEIFRSFLRTIFD